MPSAAPAADAIICGNCGIAGHYAVGCAMPSNPPPTSNSDEQRYEEGTSRVNVEVEVNANFGHEEQPTSNSTHGDDGFLSDFLSSM